MAYGACNDCGNSYSECECRERERVKREEAEQERRAREWEAMRPPGWLAQHESLHMRFRKMRQHG